MLEIRERQHLWDFLGLVLLSAAKTRESEVYKEAVVELDRGKKVRTWGLEAEWKPVRKHEVHRLPQVFAIVAKDGVLEGGEEEEAWVL